MARIVAGLIAGLLFGAGLAVSSMIDPAVVLAFLDVAAVSSGGWNPALALVMAAALAVTAAGYRLTLRRSAPLLAQRFQVPAARLVDVRLLVGAALFGVGWGLVGYCPGPAIAGLAAGGLKTWVFVAAMLGGMAAHRQFIAGTAAPDRPPPRSSPPTGARS
jgi:uncharacterized membrane protein YedE/YeeE